MAKTANVLVRVEPDVKEEAESILNELGVPASVVINMLYKQIRRNHNDGSKGGRFKYKIDPPQVNFKCKSI